MSEKVRIAKRSVDAAKPRSTAYRIWDAELPGFGVKILPSGVKTYVVHYRVDGGRKAKKREFTIGRHGVFTPDQAREEASKVLASARLGRDPQSQRVVTRNTLSVQELCEEYLAYGVGAKKPSTIKIDTYNINRHIVPLLGDERIDRVTRKLIERFRDDVASGVTARRSNGPRRRDESMARGGKGAATRTLGLLGAIFQYAVDQGYRQDNPVRGVKRFPDKRCDRFLSGAEIARLSEAIEACDVSVYAKTIIRVLMMTGARKGEIEQLQWREVDFAGGYLRLDDSKTGQKVIPIGPDVLELLKQTVRIEGERYVFPSLKVPGRPYVGTKKAWEIIREHAGMPDLRLHDLRHTFASLAVSQGASLPMIGKLLGHKDSKTTERYAHLQADPLRSLAATVAQAIKQS